ncbi:uncharacterized protein Z520_04674 [Fonsecaea multimorphosa CBS 102226]|uniref:Uncharacterized protein n=1 Tax=Fonsecaea multimorphosa CBS 102226 TaxID=1442371 RepID=A0A0D2HDS0_9EURO|nr:uncharacterized protein Z520_04674 [Fonsecaea multimorphosa CBS 102226]KIY00036.1 hypothetical protein Z520_04674 [Fonsecaea multimorphosa CBS 102226]
MLPVTATFAPAFAVYYALLNLRVSMVRVSCNTMMGTDAANKSSKSSQSSSALKPDYSNDLLVSARCHANFVENVPYALLVASFVELNGGNTRFLTASLAALLFFRVAHVEFGLKAKDSMGWGRPVGYFGTLGFVVGMSSYAAWLSPLSPPPYLDCNCEPHKHGMIVKDPPVCSRCADQPESLAKLEQHVRVPRKGSDSVLPPKGLLDGASSRLSLTNPLDPEANRLGNVSQRHQMPTPWMTLLSSDRRGEPFGTPLQKQGRAYSTSFTTAPQSPGVIHGVSRPEFSRLPRPGLSKRLPILSPESVAASHTHLVEQIPAGSSNHQEFEASPPTQSSASPSQCLRTPASDYADRSQSDARSRIRRSISTTKAINPFRRSSTAKSSLAPAESCGPAKMHTPQSSQDNVPGRAPFFKDLSAFFNLRSKAGKPSPPRRFSPVSTRANESGSSLDRACQRCGVDMSDWWVRRQSGAQSRDSEGDRGRPVDRICESCKAAGTVARAMPGAWD